MVAGGGKSEEKEETQDEQPAENAEERPAEETADKTESESESESEAGGPDHKRVEDAGQSESTGTEKAAPAGGVRISPLARKLADEHGLDVNQIEGSGPEGRIIKRDVLAAAEGKGGKKTPPKKPAAEKEAPAQKFTPQPRTAPAPSGGGEPSPIEEKSIPLSNMRKTIAKRLVESKTQVPHFQVSVRSTSTR